MSDGETCRLPYTIDGIHILPVLHERLEYADCVRQASEALRPDAVVVEIPSSLERLWLQALDRLPQISVLLYENAAGRTVYMPVQPADPIVEAARAAREEGMIVRCADLDVDDYPEFRESAPDPYALLRLGHDAVYGEYLKTEPLRHPLDQRRESCMAYHARQLVDEGAERVLLLCGMHHAPGVALQLQREQAIPLTPPRRVNARLVHLHPESMGEVLADLPFNVAVYETRRKTLPPRPAPREPEPARERIGFRVLTGGRPEEHLRLREAIARAAHESLSRSRQTLLQTTPGERPGPMDRLRSQWVLLQTAEHALVAAAPDEEVRGWQRENLARFSRNLTLSSGQLVPDLFDLLSAARGCVSENYAWELHRLATSYPDQSETATDLPTARIRADEIYDGTRRIRLERRIRRPKRPRWQDLMRDRRRRKERWAGEWLEGFDENSICSYPPEDIVIEDFGRYLQRRGKSVLSEERTRSVPFTSSVLDGIDVRETIRHWSEGRIFVRELGRDPGHVGSVVVIFDPEEDRYPYEGTWLGEHDQESDMAFYSTDPPQGIVGPGICRVTYGGLLLSHPPQRMADVWTDPDYRPAETRAEVLLLAALDYCTGNIVVHVAAKPPRSILRQLAGRLGLKILHLPIGTISPTTLRRIRVMHVLSGHDKRKIAMDYIW